MRADGTTEPDQRPPLEIRNGPENAIKPESAWPQFVINEFTHKFMTELIRSFMTLVPTSPRVRSLLETPLRPREDPADTALMEDITPVGRG